MPSSMDNVGPIDASVSAPGSGSGGPHGELPGYETRDADTRGVLVFLVVLTVVIALVLLFTWRLFHRFNAAAERAVPVSPFADIRQIPPEPQLQVNPRQDLQHVLAKQQQELQTYSWVDRRAGTVRVPIDRAMDLLLERGLPIVPSTERSGQDHSGLQDASPAEPTSNSAPPGTNSAAQ